MRVEEDKEAFVSLPVDSMWTYNDLHGGKRESCKIMSTSPVEKQLVNFKKTLNAAKYGKKAVNTEATAGSDADFFDK